jgi:hypothetical protein
MKDINKVDSNYLRTWLFFYFYHQYIDGKNNIPTLLDDLSVWKKFTTLFLTNKIIIQKSEV